MEIVRSIPELFTQRFMHTEKIRFFRRVLYVFLLINALSLLPIAYDLYGYHGMIGTRGWSTQLPWYKQGTKALLNVLSHPANSKYEWVYLVFVWGQIVFLITGLLRIFPWLSGIMVYFFTINLHHKGYLAFTGGEALVNIVLFYLMFIHVAREKGIFGELQNIINNIFYWILLIQICVLYFMSAAYKLIDETWLDGSALQYIARIDAYSSPLLGPLKDNAVLAVILTYLTLAYQVMFPIAVWIKKVKIPFLIFGVLFHLGISFGMGIFTFGIIMIIMYILFLNDDQIRNLKNRLRLRRPLSPET